MARRGAVARKVFLVCFENRFPTVAKCRQTLAPDLVGHFCDIPSPTNTRFSRQSGHSHWQDHCKLPGMKQIMKINKRNTGIMALLAFIMLSFAGCKDAEEIADKLTQFTFGTEYTFKVPPNSILDIPVSIVTPEIETKSNTTFSDNNTRADMVERINLKELTLTVTSPSDGSLKFLKSVDIKVAAEGLPEVRVAYKDVVPNDVKGFLTLDVTGVELKQYFTKDKYTLRITVVADEAITEEYVIRSNGLFFVDAKILGQ
jgi:hypothetical protein